VRLIAKLCIAAIAWSVVPVLLVTDAGAADNKVFRFTYPVTAAHEASFGPGGARSIRGFAGLAFTGGPGPEATLTTLNVTVLEQPVACSGAVPSTLGGEWQVEWVSDCVNPAEFCVLRFTTPKGPVTIQRAYWANALGDSIAPAIVEMLNAPAANDWALVTLMTALAFVGAGFVMRRRPVSARR